MPSCDLCRANDSAPFAEKHDLQYLRCRRCGFVYSDISDFDFAAFNEDIIEDLQESHVRKLESARHLKNIRQRLREFEPYRQTGRFLEIGCSTGSFLSQVRDAGWQERGWNRWPPQRAMASSSWG